MNDTQPFDPYGAIDIQPSLNSKARGILDSTHLPIATSDKRAHIVLLQKPNGRVGIAIELHEDATHETIRDLAGLAIQWRKAINLIQGKRYEPRWAFEMKVKGKTYPQVAEYINTRYLAVLLKWGYPDIVASVLANEFRLEEDAQQIVADGLKRISEGEEPFERDFPVTAKRLREIYKDLKKKGAKLA